MHFLLQKITNNDSNKQNQCLSPYPSPVSSKSPTDTEYHHENENHRGVIENHQKTHIPNQLTPNEDELNTKNLLPVITPVTPVQSTNRPQSAQSESVISTTPVSELEGEPERIIYKSVESPSATDDEDDEDEDEDVRELEGRTVTSKGQMVNIRYNFCSVLVFLVLLK